MRKFTNRWLMPLSALAIGSTAMGFSCSGMPGPLAIFGGTSGLIQTVGLQVAAELAQAVLILLLGPASLSGPFPVPGVTA